MKREKRRKGRGGEMMGHGGWATDKVKKRREKKRKEKKRKHKGIMDLLLFCISEEAVLLNGSKKQIQLPKRSCSFMRVGTKAVFGGAEVLSNGPFICYSDIAQLAAWTVAPASFLPGLGSELPPVHSHSMIGSRRFLRWT